MYLSIRFRKRALTAACLVAAITPLTGCQNRKIIARVNDMPINDEDYKDYVSHVKATDFQQLTQQGVSTDAGGAGLINLIKDKLLEKLAEDKKISISDEVISRYQQYALRSNPRLIASLATGQITKEELPRLIRDQIIIMGLGSTNATVPEEDIKKEFETNKTQYNYPEMVGIRAVPVPSEAEGIQLISQINASHDFGSAASKFNPQAGLVRYVPFETLPPNLKEVLTPLKEGQLAPAPVALQGSGGTQTAMLVVQLVKRMPKGDATLADAHEAIRQRKLQETQPQILAHSQELINEYNKSARVEVYDDRYKDIVRAALTPPPSPLGMGGPGGPPPGGAPPSGSPSMPRPGAAGNGRPMMLRPGTGAAQPGAGTNMPRPGMNTAPSRANTPPSGTSTTPSGANTPPSGTNTPPPDASGTPRASSPGTGSASPTPKAGQ